MDDEQKPKRQRINYNDISSLEAKRLVQRLENNCEIVDSCKLFKGSLNTDGYAQIQLKGQGPTRGKRNLLGHVIALRAAELPAPKEGEHASHRCHRRNCFNATHLVVESALLNNQRKGCPGDVACKCCHCQVLAYECPHIPKCLKK